MLSVLLTAANHLLAQQPALTQRLQPHAEQTLCVTVNQHHWFARINAQGYFCAQPPLENPTLQITLPLSALPTLIRRDEWALRQLPIQGDMALGQTLFTLLQDLHWDLSATLSPWLGDLLAQRLGDTAQQCLHWQRQVRTNTLTQLADYLTDEAALLNRRVVLENWLHAIDTLSDDVARLEARLNALENRPFSCSH